MEAFVGGDLLEGPGMSEHGLSPGFSCSTEKTGFYGANTPKTTGTPADVQLQKPLLGLFSSFTSYGQCYKFCQSLPLFMCFRSPESSIIKLFVKAMCPEA